MTIKNYLAITATLLIGVMLSGCHTAPKTMYEWGDYQPVVYKNFKGASPEEQIAVLEQNLEMIKSKGNLVPPGFHAHLGMLYASVGKGDLGAQEFLTEKKLFPESASYMDFLLNKTPKKGQ